MRDISKGVNTVQGRIDLQHREMQRQLLKLAELQELIASASSSPSSINPGSKQKGDMQARVERIVATQTALGSRLDVVLQRLMDAHSATYEEGLSEFEKEWFGELGRMKREVGADEQEGRSLKGRADLVNTFYLSTSFFSFMMLTILHF